MLDQAIDLDRAFHALVDRTRRSMLERLAMGPATVGDLAQPFDMSLAAVVQHVQVLESCGLVRTQKIGRKRICRLDTAGISAVEKWMADRRHTWEARLDRLGEVLNDDQTNL